jgi:hypothetical protein
MSWLVSLFRDLGLKGSAIAFTVFYFLYLSISHGITDGWISGLGYLVAGAGIIGILLGLAMDGAAQTILGGISIILTIAGFFAGLSQVMDIDERSTNDLNEALSCGYNPRCSEAAVKRAVCGEMKSIELTGRLLASAQVGLSTPKEASPFVDEKVQRDLNGVFPKCSL